MAAKDDTTPAQKMQTAIQFEGLESTPSVWMEQGSKGEIRYGVKVYDADPEVAAKRVARIFLMMKGLADNVTTEDYPAWVKREAGAELTQKSKLLKIKPPQVI